MCHLSSVCRVEVSLLIEQCIQYDVLKIRENLDYSYRNYGMSVTIGSENVVMIKIYSPRFMKAQRMGGNLRCNLIRMPNSKSFQRASIVM